MALTATVDLTKTPIELRVVSDRRKVEVTAFSVGETAVGTALFPVPVITDASGRVWTKKSDDGVTTVYTSS
ncbi:hypothetical protein J2X63_003162 [Agromyces sp. 3263]|uniref:hypothetical protein n=1 Tax=Agromyces sp. 3263 TaxID=2817750 RepID=UPI002866211C|nr:hypothetical protein [Agromyces sp. 3263]MDR6907454.1 hypothetical protein [Agromyces sp. 3263]